MEVIGSLGGTAHGAYTIDVLPPKERVTSRAYMYSALNVGFTLGSLVGGIALAFDSITLLTAVPWFTAAVFMVNAVAVTRLPDASHDLKTVGGAQGQDRRTRADEEPRVAGCHVLQRHAVDQPGHPQPGHPAVAGRQDRRALGGARLPLRHQHGDVHLPAPGGRPRDQGQRDRAARHPPLDGVLHRLLRGHALDPPLGRALDSAAVLPGSRHADRRRALPLGRQLDVRGRADGSAATRGVPRRSRAQQHPRPGLGACPLHLPGDELGLHGLADHRGHHHRRGCGTAPVGHDGATLPRGARPGRRARRRVRARGLGEPDDLAPVGPPTVEQPAEPGGISPLSQSTGGNTD